MQTIAVEQEIALVVEGHPVHPDHALIRDERPDRACSRIEHADASSLEHRVVDKPLIVGPHSVGVGALVPVVDDRGRDPRVIDVEVAQQRRVD